jgi:hypothetical protein
MRSVSSFVAGLNKSLPLPNGLSLAVLFDSMMRSAMSSSKTTICPKLAVAMMRLPSVGTLPYCCCVQNDTTAGRTTLVLQAACHGKGSGDEAAVPQHEMDWKSKKVKVLHH